MSLGNILRCRSIDTFSDKSHRIILKNASCLNRGSVSTLSRVADLAAERTKKSQLQGTKDAGVSAATSDKRRSDKFTVGYCEIDKHNIRSHEREWIKNLERRASRRKEQEEKHAKHLVLNLSLMSSKN